ncbi:MAG: phenylalanine--tRNA ligase subunit beta [Spirochaetota bacterium]
MKIPLSWLKEYVDLENITPEMLSERLTLSGAEVSSLTRIGADIPGVIIGRIVSFEKHPNADKLSVCSVDLGRLGVKSIVCGAPNVKAEALVPVATVGTVFPNGLVIKKAKLRGVESSGMICSKAELGLEETSDGIWLIDAPVEPGDAIQSVLGGGDYVFEFEITPNRGDLLSVAGMAREAASVFDRRFVMPETKAFEHRTGNVDISIEDTTGCPRYSARMITGVRIGPSPRWMAERLERAGLRSINNVVDVTNYIMLEYGQPLHAFDLTKIEEKKIIVRRAKKGETITVIDGSTHTLSEDILLICDGKKPIAAAGIMGGANSEIDNNTKDILLESAFFDPVTVRKGSKMIGLKSDASYRFERGINPETTVMALNRAVELIIETAGGEIASTAKDIYPSPFEPRTIVFNCDLVQKHLGVELSRSDVHAVFKRMGFMMANIGENSLKIEIPVYRPDLTAEIDLVEEIARLVGYNDIPSAMPRIASQKVENDYHAMLALSSYAASCGLTQTVHYSMTDSSLESRIGTDASRFIPVISPLSNEHDILRPGLFAGMMRTALHNRSRGKTGGAYFELGSVFTKDGDGYSERKMLAALFIGTTDEKKWNNAERMYDFFDATGILESIIVKYLKRPGYGLTPSADPRFVPTVCARVNAAGKDIGVAGEVTPTIRKVFDIKERVFYFEIDALALLGMEGRTGFNELWKFPPVYRDLALVLDRTTPFSSVIDAIRAFDTQIRDVSVVDVYEGDQVPAGKRSVAVAVVYNHPDKTLTAPEAEAIEKGALAMLEKKFGITLRS